MELVPVLLEGLPTAFDVPHASSIELTSTPLVNTSLCKVYALLGQPPQPFMFRMLPALSCSTPLVSTFLWHGYALLGQCFPYVAQAACLHVVYLWVAAAPLAHLQQQRPVAVWWPLSHYLLQ